MRPAMSGGARTRNHQGELMKSGNIIVAIALFAFMLGFSGCGAKNPSEAIQKWKLAGKTEKIIEMTVGQQQAVRLEAIAALAELNEMEALGNLFGDDDPVVAHEAVVGIATIGGPESEPYLIEATKLKFPKTRAYACSELANYSSPAAIDALVKAMDVFQFPEVVLAAIAALGEIGDPSAVAPLSEKLKERAYDIRGASLQALVELGGDAAMTAVATRMGDVKDTIRTAAIEALIANGAASAPIVASSFRSEDRAVRNGALEVSAGIDVIPESGSDLVWYHLAKLTAEKDAPVEVAQAAVFADIEDALPGLLEGLSNASPEVRGYVSIALENVGESAVGPVVELAEGKASEKALGWFNERETWSGGASWRIDLWAASSALSPDFKFNPVYVDLLKQAGEKGGKVTTSDHFRPTRAYIPYLILQLADRKPVFDRDSRESRRALKLYAARSESTQKHFDKAGHNAVFPLVVSMNAKKSAVAVGAAQQLKAMEDPRVVGFIQADLEAKLNPPVDVTVDEDGEPLEEAVIEDMRVAASRQAGVDLSGTPYHKALLAFDHPELGPDFMKIRPSEAVAVQAFNAVHPDVEVKVKPARDADASSASFILSFYHSGAIRDVNVAYQISRDGTWRMQSQIPSSLP